VVSGIGTVTVDEFYQFIMQPENRAQSFELIAGEIIEKMVSNPRSSIIANWIMSRVTIFVDENDLGHVSGADGGYVVSGDRYIPDGAFISKERCPIIPEDAYNPTPPDLALEVLSPSNTDEEMRVKLSNYLAAGTVVWIVASGKRIEVHRPGQPAQILLDGDTLAGGDVLPGFKLPVVDILAK
jgi:Uma2 family endonuclease